jgi:hypothetical protein
LVCVCQYASREIRLTLEANELLKTAGDKQGVQVGEEYLRAIEDILAKDGIKLGAAKGAAKVAGIKPDPASY